MKKHNKKLIGLSLLLAAVMLSGLLLTGCLGGSSQIAWSGPTVAEGNVYVGSLGKMYALQAENGNYVWQEELETEGSSGGLGCSMSSMSIPIYGETAVYGELVYVGGYDGKVYAYTTESGALRWVYPRSGNLGAVILGGTVVSQDVLYFCTFSGVVYALDAETGDEIWNYDIDEDVWATPAVSGDTLYIGTFDKNIYALDINTGQPKWAEPFQTGGPVLATPAVNDGVVYAASFDRHVYALDSASGQQIWQYPDNGSDDTPSKWFWADPILSNGSIYAANMDGKMYVIDAFTGALRADFDLEGAVSSTPVTVGDYVYVATEEGEVFAIDTVNMQMEQVRDLGLRVIAPLAAADGIVYIHTHDEEAIYALNTETGTLTWDTPLGSE